MGAEHDQLTDSGPVVLVSTPELAGWLWTQLTRSTRVRTGRVAGVVLTDGTRAEGLDDRVPVLGRVRGLEGVVRSMQGGFGVACVPRAMSRVRGVIEASFRDAGVPLRWVESIDDALFGGEIGSGVLDFGQLLGRPTRLGVSTHGSAVRGKRVLITGAGGSIGSELARQCASAGAASMLIMDRSERALFEIDHELKRRGASDVRAVLNDVVDGEGTGRWFDRFRPEVVFHAAAHKHVPLMEDHPHEAIRNNVLGTVSVVDAACAVGAERMVLVSTDKAVEPSSVMGATKRIAELYVRSRNARGAGAGGTRCSLVRFGNVLGSSGSVLEVWRRQIADGGPLTVTDPRMTRYFMTIPEAAGLVIGTATLSTEGGGVFVLDMGEPARIVDLAAAFCRSLGLTPRFVDGPHSVAGGTQVPDGVALMDIAFTGARPGEKLHEELVYPTEQLEPTAVPGVRSWPGAAIEPSVGDEIRETVRALGRSGDGEAAMRVIRAWIPGFQGSVQDSNTASPGASLAA